MADGVWKCIYPQVFGRSKQLLLNKFFDPSTPSMRKGRDRGEKREKNTGEKTKQKKTDDYSGHYVIASSQPLERRPLEHRMLVPKEKKRMSFLVATTSLPAVDRPYDAA